MRKQDEDKPIIAKVAKTLSMDKSVILKLEERAKEVGMSVSELVNIILINNLVTREKYYSELAKYYKEQFDRAIFLKDFRCEVKK